MDGNKQLEELSNKVRRGEAVGFWEAIAVIDYQNGLREEREAAKARAPRPPYAGSGAGGGGHKTRSRRMGDLPQRL